MYVKRVPYFTVAVKVREGESGCRMGSTALKQDSQNELFVRHLWAPNYAQQEFAFGREV